MRYETIILEREESGLTRLTLNRPDKHHAFDAKMISELHQAADQMAADEACMWC